MASDPIQLNKAIGELLKYSLIRRDPKTKTLTVHRLVQAVLKDGMSKDEQRQWAERAVIAVYNTFPPPDDFTNWGLCGRCLPYAQTCAVLIDQWDITFDEVARLLNETGLYLKGRARYAEAEPLYQRAIAIGEKTLGAEHPLLATYLNNLANLYTNQGKYAEAEPLYQRALKLIEKALGANHPDVATVLQNYAYILRKTNRESEATELEARAKAIRAKHAQENAIGRGD